MWGGEPRHDVPNPYMMCEAPTWRSRRLMVTERGISYRGRPPRKRSSQSNREGHVSKGEVEKVVHRVKGHRWSDERQLAVRELRRASMALNVTCRLWATGWTTGERSDTETVTLREARGDGKRAIVRWYLAGRLLNSGHLYAKTALERRRSRCQTGSFCTDVLCSQRREEEAVSPH